MKYFVKALPKHEENVKQKKVFCGPNICNMIFDFNCKASITTNEKEAYISFKQIVTNF